MEREVRHSARHVEILKDERADIVKEIETGVPRLPRAPGSIEDEAWP